jgi:fatty acid desaturase
MDNELPKYKMICTLKFGDIYGQIIVWLIVIFVSLATTLALWSSTRQIYALATVGIVLVLSLPFLLFAFVTTLLNRIEFIPEEAEETVSRRTLRSSSARTSSQKPAGASS